MKIMKKNEYTFQFFCNILYIGDKVNKNRSLSILKELFNELKNNCKYYYKIEDTINVVLNYNISEESKKDRVTKIVIRNDESKLLKNISEYFKQLFIYNNTINRINVLKFGSIVNHTIEKLNLGLDIGVIKKNVINQLMPKANEVLIEDAISKLKNEKDIDYKFTCLVALTLFTDDDAKDISKAFVNNNTDDKKLKAAALELNLIYGNNLIESLENYVFNNNVSNLLENLKHEEILYLLLRYTEDLYNEQDYDHTLKICLKEIGEASNDYTSDKFKSEYAYIIRFYLQCIDCYWRINKLTEHKQYIDKAKEYRDKRRICIDDIDLVELDNKNPNSELDKKEGLFYRRFRDLDRCIILYSASIDKASNYTHNDLSKIYGDYAVALRHMHLFDRAIDCYNKAIELRKGDSSGIALQKSNLGILMNVCHDFDEADINFTEAEEIRKNNNKYKHKYYITLNNHAMVYINRAVYGEQKAAMWDKQLQLIFNDCIKGFNTVLQTEDIKNEISGLNLKIAIFLYLVGLSKKRQILINENDEYLKSFIVKAESNQDKYNKIFKYSQTGFRTIIEFIESKIKEYGEEKYNEISFGERRYGVYHVLACVGAVMASAKSNGSAKECNFEFNKIFEELKILKKDSSIKSEYYFAVATAFYGMFLIQNKEEITAEIKNTIIKYLEEAQKIISDISKDGKNTVKALETLKVVTDKWLFYFSKDEEPEDEFIQKHEKQLITYLFFSI